jgi:hypothetical protein
MPPFIEMAMPANRTRAMVDIINLENLVALLFVKIEEVPKQ